MIRIYESKRLYSHNWVSDELREVTLSARQSFLRYGNRDLLDKYDSKSSIYLARATSFSETSDGVAPVEEFMSVRIVPGGGRFPGCGELEINIFDGGTMDEVIRDRFFGGQDSFWSSMAASSRMCGIHPFYLHLEDEIKNKPLSLRHKYSSYCYSLINYQFLVDYPNFNPRFITGIISDNFVNNVLTLGVGQTRIGPCFVPAYKFMGLANKNEIRLDRNVYSYQFPIYWLNFDQLIEALKSYIAEGLLTDDTIRCYLKTDLSFEKIKKSRISPELARLGDLITATGVIRGAQISGEELRRMIDLHVDDEPELKITSYELWKEALIRFEKDSGLVSM